METGLKSWVQSAVAGRWCADEQASEDLVNALMWLAVHPWCDKRRVLGCPGEANGHSPACICLDGWVLLELVCS